MSSAGPVEAVVIGRNEGARLLACLKSLQGQVRRTVYVDSGSTDGSVEAAAALGAHVVELDMSRSFTAARARNAGLAATGPDTALVQFVDGDCIVQPGWIAAAAAFLAAHPGAAAACGRRREAHPEASVYNRLCDREWDTPAGETAACGGDVLMRAAPLRDAGGYREDLIAGEEPELCLRLRHAGWTIWRLKAEMTLHDAKMTRFRQWWKRSRRAGHAFAEGAALHGKGPERHWVRETRRAAVWGAALPLLILLGSLAYTPAALLALAYPAQLARLSLRDGWEAGLFQLIGKFPEAQGAAEYHLRRLSGRRRGLIEYK